MSNKQRFLDYIGYYSKKNLHAISMMLAVDVTLRDWNISVSGKTAFLEETANNFDSVETIQIELCSMYENQNIVAAELIILVNGQIELPVVDVIAFDSSNQIQSIRAYRG